MHPLLAALLAAADGRFPPDDGGFTRVDPVGEGRAVVAFTAHAYVLAPLPVVPPMPDVPAPDGYGGAHDPRYLSWLAGPNAVLGSLDVVLVARGAGGGGGSLTEGGVFDDHVRVGHARRWRQSVRAFGDERGVGTLSTGLCGRRELSVEASAAGQGRGWGRSLARDLLGLVPLGEPVFAAVAAGNARSLRAFLGLGFVPIASEQQWLPASSAALRAGPA